MKTKRLILFIFWLLVAGFLLKANSVRSQTVTQTPPSSVIDATVDTSLCGDGVIEGPEDCEGKDLNGMKCKDLGYSGGSLDCNADCSFDISGCVRPTPTLHPTAASPAPTDSQTQLAEITTSDESDQPSNVPAFVQDLVERVSEGIKKITGRDKKEKKEREMPQTIKKFDKNKNQKIEIVEVHEAVSFWIRDWAKIMRRKKELSEEERIKNLPTEINQTVCDINQDANCDLTDFSVLLYYTDSVDFSLAE